MSIRIPTTHININLKAKMVSLNLDGDWVLDNELNINKLYINNLSEVNAQGLNLMKMNLDGNCEMFLDGKLQFSELSLSENSLVTLRFDENITTISVLRDSVIGSIYTDTAEIKILAYDDETNHSIQDIIPEFIDFSTVKSVGEPIIIQFSDTAEWYMENGMLD